MMTVRFVLALGLLLSAAVSTRAGSDDSIFSSGTNFYEACAAAEKLGPEASPTRVEIRNAAECIGFLVGVNEAVSGAEAAHNIEPSDGLICLPENSTNIQELRVVRKYISDHPKEAYQPAVVQVINALHEAFPCKGLFRAPPKGR